MPILKMVVAWAPQDLAGSSSPTPAITPPVPPKPRPGASGRCPAGGSRSGGKVPGPCVASDWSAVPGVGARKVAASPKGETSAWLPARGNRERRNEGSVCSAGYSTPLLHFSQDMLERTSCTASVRCSFDSGGGAYRPLLQGEERDRPYNLMPADVAGCRNAGFL